MTLFRCTPQENIVFLKTHKTGSSTLTNIFNRFADLRELTVALPAVGFNRFRWPLPFHWTYVDMFLLDENYANILCNHARYVRESMDAIMELDAKYVTILRNPIQQFESMFDYMEFSKFFGLQNTTDPMRRFLRKPFQYIRNMTVRLQMFPESMHLIRNGQFFDLGLNPRSYDNRTLVLKEIEKIDRDFSLVLIMEYFDESLVLLKREMCWDLEDIVYAKFNQRHRVKKEHLDGNLKRMIERWNGADVLLYRHFNKTFWNKIKSHGKAFYRDLKELREKNSQVQQECISPVMAKERAFRLTKEVTKLQLNPKVTNFNRYFCHKILTDEIAYLKYFRFKQNPYFGYQRSLRAERNLPPKEMPLVRSIPQFTSQQNFHQGFAQPKINSREPTFASRPQQQQQNFQPQQNQFKRHETFQPQNSASDPNLINKPQFIDIPPNVPF